MEALADFTIEFANANKIEEAVTSRAPSSPYHLEPFLLMASLDRKALGARAVIVRLAGYKFNYAVRFF